MRAAARSLAGGAALLLAVGGPASRLAAAPDPLEDLAFIAGSWEGPLFGGLADETWLPPRDGTMAGVFRLTWPDSDRRLYEFLLIEAGAEGIVELTFRHFDRGMELWEREIAEPNRLQLVEASGARAVFEAADRTREPARFVFEGTGDGTGLVITVASLHENGTVRESFDAVYTRKPASPPGEN